MCGGVHLLEELSSHSFRAFVAIADGIADEASVAVDESEVHSPRVHGYSLHVQFQGSRLAQSFLHVGKECGEVPVESFSEAHLPVCETVYHLHVKALLSVLSSGECSGDDAS